MKFLNIPEAIRGVAEQLPAKTAIESGKGHVSYAVLEKKSNQIANFFRSRLGENKNVFILMEKSPELIEVILGVLKAGGIFVPLDVKYPDRRLQQMMKEVQSKWIVLPSTELSRLEAIADLSEPEMNVLIIGETCKVDVVGVKSFSLDDGLSTEYCIAAENLNKHCYIYFTSGSTGTPKGVVGRHRSLQHFIEWEISEFAINESFRFGQLTSPSFDPYLRDIFVPLCAGATICIPDSMETILHPERLLRWLEEHQVSFLHMTPSLFKSLSTQLTTADRLPMLKYIALAGEKLRGNDVRPFLELFQTRIQLVNFYGPTETTLAKLFYRIKPEDAVRVNIPVGRPIEGAQVIVLDRMLNQCPVEKVGEVYIRTPYISSGYYNQPALTREVFISNPFSKNQQDLIYKTGDLGKILVDGNLELIGRADYQVKIRGMRLEPGEIENKILAVPDIEEAIILVREDQAEDQYLCAYFVAKKEITPAELKAFLARELPEYMVPTHFVRLARMPLTPNGKIDRQALPEPDFRAATSAPYMAPTNPLEEKLTQIWSKVLGVQEVGIMDHFFELGGHSLKAATLVSHVYQELAVELPIGEIFSYPVLKDMAKVITGLEQKGYITIPRVEERSNYPLSSAQKRLFILHHTSEANISYNMPGVLTIQGPLERQKLSDAFKTLIRRHESLRTSFAVVEGEPVQIVHPEVEFHLDYQEAETEGVEEWVREFVKPFQINQAPLLRARLVKCGDRHILMYDLHHLISDGTSNTILVTEFIQLYLGVTLPELRIQYRDFAVWQNNFFQSEQVKKQEEFWHTTFAGELPDLQLPTDFPRPGTPFYEGDALSCKLDRELTAGVYRLASENGATLFMVLYTVFSILLSKWCGRDDIIIGSSIAGRPHPDLHKVIGMFVNTVAIRTRPVANKTVKEYLAEVKETVLLVFENQDYPFEMLVDQLALSVQPNRSPLFDVSFVLQNMDQAEVVAEGLTFTPYGFQNQTSKFDLSLYAIELEDEIDVVFKYRTRLFQRKTIEKLAERWREMIRMVIENPEITIAKMERVAVIENESLVAGLTGSLEEDW